MKKTVIDILSGIEECLQGNTEHSTFRNGVFILKNGDILACERAVGDSRYPYDMDGRVLWVHSSGHIDCNEGDLQIFHAASPGEPPCVEFWGGIQNGAGWMPISITGATALPGEAEFVKRYTVFTKRTAYYLADTADALFALRAGISSKKQLCFTALAVNRRDTETNLYLSGFMDPLLRRAHTDTAWRPVSRVGTLEANGTFKIVRNPDPEEDAERNIAVIRREIESDGVYKENATVALTTFLGGAGRTVSNAGTLYTGAYQREARSVNTTDVAIASHLVQVTLPPNCEMEIHYTVDICHDAAEATCLTRMPFSREALENDLSTQAEKEAAQMSALRIQFGDLTYAGIEPSVFNRFLQSLQKQVSLCALGKNYSGPLLGVRDVFQQLTAVQLWDPVGARRQIVRCFHYIMQNGRAPRQFSIVEDANTMPVFDIRQFIDQGLWIIETVYKYLCWTGDQSILHEICGYYEILDEKKGTFRKSDDSDSVLAHLLRITQYLLSNLDPQTGCLKILYGDWNDAVDGLGKTDVPEAEFGTGVSVMATLQLYQALKEMREILSCTGEKTQEITQIEKMRDAIALGLKRYALAGEGAQRRILHGWGDRRSYLVGSLCDPDGQSRYSATSHSFWVISDMLERAPEIKQDILRAFNALDSQYGIKTFEPCFPADIQGCGRIGGLTPGTFENGCAYVHCTTFAIMALFRMGEPAKAWEQIGKILPFTHAHVTKTPFVMPNSYCHNDEFEFDGDSFGDWYTGSGAVLFRCILEYALGLRAEMGGLMVATPSYVPSNRVTVNMTVRNCNIHYTYENKQKKVRTYIVNGTQYPEQSLSTYNRGIFIAQEQLRDNLSIQVID